MNSFYNSVAEKNYNPIALYIKWPEEAQAATELFPVISLYGIDGTVGWCLDHVKASSQNPGVLEDFSILLLGRFRCGHVGTIAGNQSEIHLRWYSCVC